MQLRANEKLEKYAGVDQDKEEDAHRVMRALDVMDEIVSGGRHWNFPSLKKMKNGK